MNSEEKQIEEVLTLASTNKHYQMACSFFEDDPFIVRKEKILAHKMVESMVKLDNEENRNTTQITGKWIEPKMEDWMPDSWRKQMVESMTDLEERTYFWVENSKLPLEICESIARYELKKLPSKQQVKENLKLYKKKERKKEIEYKEKPELERIEKNEFIKLINKSRNNVVFF